MHVKAQAKFIRIAPKKVRLVAGLIAGMNAQKALVQLRMLNKKSSPIIEKLIKSAMANAQHNFNTAGTDLFIKEIIINQGPTMKRWDARAMGRANTILKKTSHIILVLDEKKNESGLSEDTKVVSDESAQVEVEKKESVKRISKKKTVKKKEKIK